MMWLMDVYRQEEKLILWIKDGEKNLRIERKICPCIYLSSDGEETLKKMNFHYRKVKKQDYLKQWHDVLEVPIYRDFERYISKIETVSKHRVKIYNADIKPELLFLYVNDLLPCSSVEINDDKIIPLNDDSMPPIKKIRLTIIPSKDIYLNSDSVIIQVLFDDVLIEGDEADILNRFISRFDEIDPDAIVMDYAFSHLPFLERRLIHHNLKCNLHRFDPVNLKYKGGRSYYSYGKVRYQDYAVRLHGRYLIDTSTSVGSECEPEGIVELARLCSVPFQQVASRSFGHVFQMALVRNMFNRGYLIPYKEKPVDKPMSMFTMLKGDRAGHTLDPKIGFHPEVAEIDFSSMFPWILHNHNISADTILVKGNPVERVNDLPIEITMKFQGLIPITLKPFLEKRMEYKRNPTQLNKIKSKALKWVLVSSYGYLRFREFKLGIPSSHMAICSYAREILCDTMRFAEEKGFNVVHGIVDSLYLHKKKVDEDEIIALCKELEMISGIPMSFEGVYRWIVFLPSVSDDERPVPTRYFGVFRNGEVKIRGLVCRQRNTPKIVRNVQEFAINQIKDCSTVDEIVFKIPFALKNIREIINNLGSLDRSLFICRLCLAKTEYKNDISQRRIVEELRKNSFSVMPGQIVRFIYSTKGPVLPSTFYGEIDEEYYKEQIIKAVISVYHAFGIGKNEIREMLGKERQMKLM